MEESIQLGELLTQKLNASKGHTSVMLPLKGLDKYEQPPDGPWIDAEADGALFGAIRANLRPDIRLTEIDANINDHQFADATYEELMRLWKEKENK